MTTTICIPWHRRVRAAVPGILLLAPTLITAPAHAQTTQPWTLTDLGTVPGVGTPIPVALNNHGTVILNTDPATPWTRSWIWTPTTGLQPLPHPPTAAPNEPNTATHLNDAGDVVGHVGDNPQRAWLYRNNQYTMLGTLPGYTHSAATRINAAGEILGMVGTTWATDHFFRTAAGVMTDPTPGYTATLHDLNDAGLACGSDPVLGVTVWNLRASPSTRAGFGFLPGYPDVALGTSIDALGRVAGYGWDSFASGFSLSHAFHLTPGQPLLDISGSAARRRAMSSNTAGRVVGIDLDNQNHMTGGWTWTAASGVVPLASLIPDPTQWTSFGYAFEADGINEVGQILAYGRRTNGSYHAILMSPPDFTTPLGAGCPGTAGASTIAAITAPRIGATLHVRIGAIAAPFGVLAAGTSAAAWLGVPLPIDLAPLGAPGCLLRTSTEVLATFPASGGSGTWSVTFPSDPAAIGFVFHCQALVPDPAANAFGAVLSDAATITVGG
jgi:uncharacterized membrane protein